MEYQRFIALLPQITSAYKRLLGLIKRAEAWTRKLQSSTTRSNRIIDNQFLTSAVLTASAFLNSNRNLLSNLPQTLQDASAHIETLRAQILPPDAFK